MKALREKKKTQTKNSSKKRLPNGPVRAKRPWPSSTDKKKKHDAGWFGKEKGGGCAEKKEKRRPTVAAEKTGVSAGKGKTLTSCQTTEGGSKSAANRKKKEEKTKKPGQDPKGEKKLSLAQKVSPENRKKKKGRPDPVVD